MSYLINNEQKINDIIFANRNKNYGAYAIRSSYGNTLVKSIAIMAFGFTSIMGSAYYYTHRNNTPDQNNNGILTLQDTNITIVCDLKPPKELKTEPETQTTETQKQKTTTETNNSTTIIDSTAVTTTTVSTTLINSGAITSSVTNTDGGTTTSTGTNTTLVSNSVATNVGGGVNQGYEVDSNPEFDGGLEALYRFVGSKLKYPTPAYRENKEGTVYVKFVVDENGKVCNLNLLNTAGYGMDEEALRVVALIPNFKTPAKVKGKPVKVYYQLPIKYRMH